MRGGWRADLMAAMISTVLEGTAGTLLRMAEARSDQDLMSEIARYLAQFGFSAFVLTRLSRSQGADPDILLDGWPQGWADRYAEAGHYKYDPVAKHCMDASDVFSWDEIPPPLLDDVRARSIPHEAAEFALKDGVCVPMPAALGVGECRWLAIASNTLRVSRALCVFWLVLRSRLSRPCLSRVGNRP